MHRASFEVEDPLTVASREPSKSQNPVHFVVLGIACLGVGILMGRWSASSPAAPSPEQRKHVPTPPPVWWEPTNPGTMMCEDLGYVLPANIRRDLNRSLTEAEQEETWERAGFLLPAYPRSTDMSWYLSDPPIAKWYLGPSGAGKTLMSSREQFKDILQFGNRFPAPVALDGDAFRDAHGGYKAAKHDGQRRGCVWRGAWPTVKPYRSHWLTNLTKMAKEQRRNLIIPNVCTVTEKCIRQLNELKKLGYRNDIVAVMVNETISHKRGIEREFRTGKRFAQNFDASLASISPVIKVANGDFEILDENMALTPAALRDCLIQGKCPGELVLNGTGGNASASEIEILKIETKTTKKIDALVHHIEAQDAQLKRPHLPFCQEVNHSLSEAQRAMINREYQPEELQSARKMSQLDAAAAQERPLALWILGPTGVGKSMVVKNELRRSPLMQVNGIPTECSKCEESDWANFSDLTSFKDGALQGKMNAVIIDEEFYLEAHQGLKEVVADGLLHDPPCIWELVEKESAKKQTRLIFEEAKKAKKNIVITSSCASEFESCMKTHEELKVAGYRTHVLAMHSKKSIVESRGLQRQDFKGRKYHSTFWESVGAILPMIAAANGQWKFVDSTGSPKPKFSGDGWNMNRECALTMKTLNPYLPFNRSMQDKCSNAMRKHQIMDFGEKTLEKGPEPGFWSFEMIAMDFPKISSDIWDYIYSLEHWTWMGAHLPLCEETAQNVEDHGKWWEEANRDLTPEENAEAEKISGLRTASTQTQPVAIWMLGPSNAGKSLISKGVLERFGVGSVVVDEDTGTFQKNTADVVNIASSIYRAVHKGIKSFADYGRSQAYPCIWEMAWMKGTKVRDDAKKFKQRIVQTAIKNRQNLVISTPCNNAQRCLKIVEELKRNGYVNHMIASYARRALIDERGRHRADFDGKRYTGGVDLAVEAFAPMIVSGNGQWEFIDNSGRPRVMTKGKCSKVSYTEHELELTALGVEIKRQLRRFRQSLKLRTGTSEGPSQFD